MMHYLASPKYCDNCIFKCLSQENDPFFDFLEK
jgi:hypothetical protein